MSAAAVLARGRARAQALMVDTCTVRRIIGQQTNTVDGTVTPTYDTIYSGVCRFQQITAPWAGPETVGEAGIGLFSLQVSLPVAGSQGILKDDIVTAVTAVHDADLVGKRFTVQGEGSKTHATARRLPLMEILG